jgi:N-acetyl-1-D-myo-inositol-2-amino-2-deoxy-alpha-D-glucopyranoside deacetylase
VLVAHLEELRPDVVLTYDPEGGYRHPDHVQAHRVTVAALASLPRERRPRLYVVLTPRPWAEEDREWLRNQVPDGVTSPAGGVAHGPAADAPYPPSVVADGLVTHAVADEAALRVQVAALHEHPTQVTVHEGWYTLSNDIAARLPGREGYAIWEVEGP